MKRLIALLLALTMALALVACGGNNTAGNNAGNTSGENETQPPVTEGSSDSAANAFGRACDEDTFSGKFAVHHFTFRR